MPDADFEVASLTAILAHARHRPPLEDLLDLVTSRAPALVGCDEAEVLAGQASPPVMVEAGPEPSRHVVRLPVECGRTTWGELRLTYGRPPDPAEVERGHLLAEVLGASLTIGGAQVAGVGHHQDHEDPSPRQPVDPDTLADVVLECAEALDVQREASTRTRLVLVTTRLAAAVEATGWSVSTAHRGLLHVVAEGGHPRSGSSDGPLALAEAPARLRASAGGAFHADRTQGDEVERRGLVQEGHAAVVGAGGFDLDGRSWVVDVVADRAAALQAVGPVLLALVLAALSFPGEAVVPRPLEDWVRDVYSGSTGGDRNLGVRSIGATG